MKLSTLISGAALACGLSVSAQAASNLITNGDFEMPLVGNPTFDGPGYTFRTGGNLTGFNYTPGDIRSRGVVQFNSAYGTTPPSANVGAGAQSIQLEFSGDSISQNFATIINQSYLLTFLLSAYAPAPSSLKVTVGPATGNFIGNYPTYTSQSLPFVANSTSTTLTFTNSGATFFSYPHLDNVSVTAVPEPETYALMLAGLGIIGMVARRRKQGDAA